MNFSGSLERTADYVPGDKVLIRIQYFEDIIGYALGKIDQDVEEGKDGFQIFAQIVMMKDGNVVEIGGEGYTYSKGREREFREFFDHHTILGIPSNPGEITTSNAERYLRDMAAEWEVLYHHEE